MEESARLLGRGPAATFRAVVLPQARAAIAAGGLLVFLYVIADFGAVQLLRYDTLTRAIYANRLIDPPVAAALSLVLGVLAILVVLAPAPRDRPAVRPTPGATDAPLQVAARALDGAGAGLRGRAARAGPGGAARRARLLGGARRRGGLLALHLAHRAPGPAGRAGRQHDRRQRRRGPGRRGRGAAGGLPHRRATAGGSAPAADALVTGGFALPGHRDRPGARLLDPQQPGRDRRALPDPPAAGRRLRAALRRPRAGPGAGRRDQRARGASTTPRACSGAAGSARLGLDRPPPDGARASPPAPAWCCCRP